MQEIVELKFTVSKIESVSKNENVLGLVFYQMLLTKNSQNVVTDRLLVSDEAIRVLDVRR
jgi:hypothetical protein